MKRKGNKVYVLVHHQMLGGIPFIYVAEGEMQEYNIRPAYVGSKHYCEVKLRRPRWIDENSFGPMDTYEDQFLKTKVLQKTKANYELLQQKAAKLVKSSIVKRQKTIENIKKIYGDLLENK